jgi:hypothetical protein
VCGYSITLLLSCALCALEVDSKTCVPLYTLRLQCAVTQWHCQYLFCFFMSRLQCAATQWHFQFLFCVFMLRLQCAATQWHCQFLFCFLCYVCSVRLLSDTAAVICYVRLRQTIKKRWALRKGYQLEISDPNITPWSRWWLHMHLLRACSISLIYSTVLFSSVLIFSGQVHHPNPIGLQQCRKACAASVGNKFLRKIRDECLHQASGSPVCR